MTDEERRIISEYVMRVAGVQQAGAAVSSSPWGSRIPQTGAAQPAPNLPPIEPAADAFIAELFAKYPEARFRLTQTAFVQEHALVAAQNRIQELEWELEAQTRQAQAANSRGFLGLGGSRPAPMPPRPQPMQPPGGMIPQRQGPGFLGTALMTAAGVAGGLVLGNMLMNAFTGGGSAAAASAGGGAFGQEAVPTSSAWTDPGAAANSGWGGNDASSAGYDNGSQDDATGSYDDAGGGYDEDI
ncbi:DUF2076 family protein [Sediminicoccus sp. KRV36]|uniref:DUF2076 domain-containing protein n=1 Tax=Sediminicoccus sp. KRV36 TaxID=3133721 RepID=UPI002010759B|nr:DUF2076 family protein [Sediminicoccus rosea]UPY36798.1 DUF2076 domain-containing protein [Sediminicoccus rosea]